MASEREIEKDRQRQEKEKLIVATSAMFWMDAIPGLGEIAMAGMVFDMIDAYGYNRVVDRSLLDKLIYEGTDDFDPVYRTLQFGKEAFATYLQGGKEALTKKQREVLIPSGETEIPKNTQKLKETYDGMTEKSQKTFIDSILAWATVADPRTQSAKELEGCIISMDDSDINELCKDKKYKETYLKFWNDNKEAYKKDQEQASKDYWDRYFNQEQLDKINSQDKGVRIRKVIGGSLFFLATVFSIYITYHVIYKKKR